MFVQVVTTRMGRLRHDWRRRKRRAWFAVFTGAVILTVSVVSATWAAQSDPPQSPPRQPLVDGRHLFESKGCTQCHAVSGTGENRGGPDLGQDRGWRDMMQFAGGLWNHAPMMLAKMRERGVVPSAITPEEMGNLAAYVFFVKFRSTPGDVAQGRDLFEQRQCSRCHQLGGRGGTLGPRLDELKDYASSSFMAQALWNHGPEMATKMAELKVQRPRLEPDDVAHLVAFIRGQGGSPEPMELAYAQSGSPEAGTVVFRQKGCIKCHAVAGNGGTIAPDLGRRRPLEHIGQIAGALWNHGPQMWGKMKELGIPFPRLTERDMADLLAYLSFVQFMGEGGDANRGGQLIGEKRCGQCHAIGGSGPKVGPDLATSEAVTSPDRWLAGIWNHAPQMAGKMQDAQLTWPRFDDDQMRDLVAYLKTRSHEK